MGIEKIIFYNFWHNGDIHVSRSLVRFITENIPAKEYIYHHLNSRKILKDIPNLKHNSQRLPDSYNYSGWWLDLETNILWCNTWYNAFNREEFGNCTIQTLFNIFKRGLKETIDYDLPGNCFDYLPEIDFIHFKIDNIIKFLNENNHVKNKKILITNCDVWSGQSHNFDFNPIIEYIAETFPDIIFIITNKTPLLSKRHNVYYAQDIIKADGDENNLNEISYLSQFCDILIGRSSGPDTFCLTKKNLFDETKSFICFSHENFGILEMVKAKYIMSQNYSIGNVAAVIEQEIKRRYLL